MFSKKIPLTALLGLSSVLGFIACDQPEESVSRRTLLTSAEGDSLAISGGLVSVEIESADAEQGLNLADVAVTDYKMDVTCGNNTIHRDISANFRLSNGFQNCLAKLKELTLGSTVYTQNASFSYKNYAAGEVARFHATGSGRVLYVRIDRQLPSTIQGNASVSYKFSETNDLGTINPGSASQGELSPAVLGETAPRYTLQVVADAQMRTLTIRAECRESLGGATSFGDAKCIGDDMDELKLKMLDYPAATPDQAYFDGAMADAEFAEDLPGARFQQRVQGQTNGGFSVVLSYDPDNLKDQIIILQNDGEDSYLFVKLKLQ